MKSSATKIEEAWAILTEALAQFCTQNSECPLHDALHDFDCVMRPELRSLLAGASEDDRKFDQGHNEAVDSIAKMIPAYGLRIDDLLSAVKGMIRPIPEKTAGPVVNLKAARLALKMSVDATDPDECQRRAGEALQALGGAL